MIIAHCEGINRRDSVTETFPANIRENLRPKEINSIERDQLCNLHGFKNQTGPANPTNLTRRSVLNSVWFP